MPDLIRHPDVVPTKVGNYLYYWIPVVATRNRAFAGMTTFLGTISLWTDSK